MNEDVDIKELIEDMKKIIERMDSYMLNITCDINAMVNLMVKKGVIKEGEFKKETDSYYKYFTRKKDNIKEYLKENKDIGYIG